MAFIKLGLVHAEALDRDGRLNLIGVEEMLGQEGIPYRTCTPAGLAQAIDEGVNVILLVDHACLTAGEEQLLIEVAGELPLVWSGIPREQTALLDMLGLETLFVDDVTNLRLIRLGSHPISAPFWHEKETTLRMKFVEHLHARCPDGAQEIAALTLGDGMRLGAAAFALGGPPRRVVFTFPLGKVYAYKTSYYTDGDDIDQTDFPICTIVDVLRGLLRDALCWVAGDAILARKYYWPHRDGIPRGMFSTNHDLCGYSERGLQYIRRVCEAAGVRTTFFDLYPFRLAPGAGGDHDVCLHAPDSTSYEDALSQRRALEEHQGIRVRGWRRHGYTAKEHYPAIWHNMIRAGIEWASTHNPQTHPFMGSAYHVATGNRLPGYLVDIEPGERLALLEIPCFDTGDDDRASNFDYGPKMGWGDFVATLETRVDYAARHNLMAGYLIHGWTAGVVEEEGNSRGALDAQRMLPLAIETARRRGMAFMGCEELYDWWMHRRISQVELASSGVQVEQSSDAWSLVLEFVPPPGRTLQIEIDGETADVEVWQGARGRRYLVPVPQTCSVRVRSGNK